MCPSLHRTINKPQWKLLPEGWVVHLLNSLWSDVGGTKCLSARKRRLIWSERGSAHLKWARISMRSYAGKFAAFRATWTWVQISSLVQLPVKWFPVSFFKHLCISFLNYKMEIKPVWAEAVDIKFPASPWHLRRCLSKQKLLFLW